MIRAALVMFAAVFGAMLLAEALMRLGA